MLNKTTPPGKMILIVEDEPDTAEMLIEMVQLSGYQTTHTYNGNSALNLTSQIKPNAMIVDVILPDVSGLEVIQHIRQDTDLREIPIIIISGNSQPEDIQQGIAAGATRYLTKPISYNELKESLDDLFQQKKDK